MPADTRIYTERDAMALDEDGGHYIRHVCAMTRECLHSQSQIAAELAYRDYLLARIVKAVNAPGGIPTQLIALAEELLQ